LHRLEEHSAQPETSSVRPLLCGPLAGAEFAGYRIESVLGQGGMGAVYLATHVRLGRRAALKLLLPVHALDDAFRERFVRESQIAASLDHPNVVPVYDADEEQGVLYIAMRYVEGEDLGSLLRREGRLTPERALPLIAQAASALDAAHASGLVHRDVKPANILIGAPGEHVYLTDFGVAKQATAQSLTRTGSFIGTVDYCAPEQIEGRYVDGRADVYALGCVLFECLTGRPPFAKDSEVAVLHGHLLEPPPALATLRPDLSHLDPVLAKALAKRADERYPVCSALIHALREATTRPRPARLATTRERPAAALPGTVPRAPELRPRRWRLRWLLAVGATVALTTGAAALTLLRSGDDPPVRRSHRPILATPPPPAAVANDVSLRQSSRRLTVTISFEGGAVRAGSLVRRDTAIEDGTARVELSQPRISTEVAVRKLGRVTLHLRSAKGRLIVAVTARPKAFESVEARRLPGGKSVRLVLTKAFAPARPSQPDSKPHPTAPVETTPAPNVPAPTSPATPTPQIG
jgi:serine/threonine-protein kinase